MAAKEKLALLKAEREDLVAAFNNTVAATTVSIDDDNDERYLLFSSHSGISANLLIGLERAADLAFASNCTLVLPPVLPHITAVADDLKYCKFTSKAAGSGCGPYAGYHKFVSHVRDHVTC